MNNHKNTNLNDWLAYLSIVIFSCWLMFSTFSSGEGLLHIKSKLWSDFGAHIPLIRSFSLGSNWPIEYPTFPGMPIQYHFLFYLIVGYLEKSGLPIGFAMNSMSTLGMSLMLIMIYKIGKLWGKSRLAGIISVILVLFNGSLTWMEYFNKFGWDFKALALIGEQVDFVSFGPWSGKPIAAFWNLNIYTNQRHLAFGFGLALVWLWPIIASFLGKKINYKKWFWILIPISLLLPFLHQAALIMAMIMAFWILLSDFKLLKKWWWVYFAAFLTSLPGFAFFLWSGKSQIAYEIGFLATNKTFYGLLNYWFVNIGLYLPLTIIWWLKSKPNKSAIIAAAMVIFMIANLFRLSTDMINNHKLINFFLIIMAIVSGAEISKLIKSKLNVVKLSGLLLIIPLTFSGFIDLFPIINDREGGAKDVEALPIAGWIRDNTPKDSVFLTTTNFYHPASLAGRKIFLDYGYFNWSLGYPDQERKRLLKDFWAIDITKKDLCELYSKNNISYVMITNGTDKEGDLFFSESTLVRQANVTFQNEEGIIYNIKEYCEE